MNHYTKNDLSYDEVKLDYEALLKTAEIATHYCIEQISQTTNKIRNECSILEKNPDNTSIYLNSEYLVNYSKQLATCTDTLAALREGKTRSNKKLINIPEIEKPK